MTELRPPDYTATYPSSTAYLTDTDLLTRTTWVNAKYAYLAVKKGKASGNRVALWLRWRLQHHLFHLGCFIQRHCGKVLFLGLLVLSLCCIGLKTASVETNVEKLWVEEGGRLQREIEYTRKTLGEGSGTTFELVIQTPRQGENLLSVDSMLLHLEALSAATQLEIKMFDVTWKFKDICYTTNFPQFEDYTLDHILANLLPCVIISPLDCFWEGSKLLGPEYGITIPGILGAQKWTNLNPIAMLNMMEKLGDIGLGYLPIDEIREMFDRAGITTAYQEKPCLNPNDHHCPATAPNKYSKQLPDVGAELTGGCKGFATRYMQWQEDLIIGGVQKNASGHIIRAEGLQSILQLMGEKNMYEHYADDYKVHHINWTPGKAKAVLEEWQRQFTKVVQRVVSLGHQNISSDHVFPFSSTSLFDILKEFSQISTVRVVLGYILMVVYACISLLKWSDAVQSQSGVGVAGVLLVALSVAAGLGLSSVIGIKFNASTTQIIPFLALGLGVDDMFLLAHSFGEIAQNPSIPYMEQTGECLRRTGLSVLLTSLSITVAFFMAAIIPIPALRAFVLQAGLLVVVNACTMLLVFPAIVSLDLIRRHARRIDVFCCFHGSTTNRIVNPSSELHEIPTYHPAGAPAPPPYSNPAARTSSPPPSYSERFDTVTSTQSDGTLPTTALASELSVARPHRNRNAVCPECYVSGTSSSAASRPCLSPEDGSVEWTSKCNHASQQCCRWSISWFAVRVYGPALQRTPVKVFVVLSFLALFVAGIIGTLQVRDGLDLTDVVPQHSNEYKFLEVQSQYFGFYNFFAVTKGDFDYPENQQILHNYHQSFRWIDKIIKKEDGSLPDYWLQLMRSWLLDIQKAFDADVASGCIVKEKWFSNATDDGIFGYKLMVQTGDIDDPIDRERILTGRLVSKEGIIYPPAFYNFLTAWVFNDALAYEASGANLMPFPDQSKQWTHLAIERDLKIPKWQPLTYAQFPFYLNNMVDTEVITETVNAIRNICESVERDTGLPNFPSGVPFTFWEQYVNLRFYLIVSLLCVLCGVFLVLTIVLLNPWLAVMVVLVLGMMIVQLFGAMGLLGIKLSAVPAVILIVAAGIGVEFTVHIALGYLTTLGSRTKRVQVSIEHMLAPVFHGTISTFLGVLMLVGAEFDFIVKYFFVVLSILLVLGLLNGAVLLPVLLAIIGPPPEVVPNENREMLPIPTPEPSPKPHHRRHPSSRHHLTTTRGFARGMPSDLSLSTITEESSQYSSHEITVHPELIVETSVPGTYTRNGCDPSKSESTDSSPSSATHHVTTKVRATATVKVEVHTPYSRPSAAKHSFTQSQEPQNPRGYKSKRRKTRQRPPPPPKVDKPVTEQFIVYKTGEDSDSSEKS